MTIQSDPSAEVRTDEAALRNTEILSLNVGPQHPSTHGVLRLVVDMDGEYVVRLVNHMGYLHTGFEKTMEHRTYHQNITYAPRTDYLHSFGHELAYVLSVEKLLGADIPERANVVRVILHELGRIASHLVFIGTGMLDLGAITPFFYAFRERETILDLFEEVSGYRMNQSWLRVGGLSRDIPDGWAQHVGEFVGVLDSKIDEYESLFAQNPIFLDRAKHVGVIGAELALDLGLTGPNLRASGVNYDVRKASPYCGLEQYDFQVPVSQDGDSLARFMLRVQEMRESGRIIAQAVNKLRPGPFKDPNRKISLPPREALETSMEAVIHHFKLVTEGFHPPAGEVYVPVESARGEVGYYLVSDGGSMPYRVKIRAPSFVNLQAMEYAGVGGQFADLITVLASMDPVMGDVDR
ncbi:NADH dehydrogenase (quinone) subunit D [Deinococcus peraridilitoris]|uniref:NADH-quinone oxidoreductase subunit D n=1 Tax=Deinococcus peraridilitoris (strain DSM 19664 / LMG 22246 / CIP 109416 / KR-200) TaxID=937777 RepID=L0A5Q2_DEIPD|nr:NADH dehydrogenase (quinone) subunit D [Deinococcus peraridilitoris]AFZ68769.1 NADH dehydrogenase I, D subunit [Deinococcus peraridilitoris DSM 19664]